MENHTDVIEEVKKEYTGKWKLCFQWVKYNYKDGSESEFGYRFIWKKPDGSLQPARGQARIPDSIALLELIYKASEAGWFVNVEKER